MYKGVVAHYWIFVFKRSRFVFSNLLRFRRTPIFTVISIFRRRLSRSCTFLSNFAVWVSICKKWGSYIFAQRIPFTEAKSAAGLYISLTIFKYRNWPSNPVNWASFLWHFLYRIQFLNKFAFYFWMCAFEYFESCRRLILLLNRATHKIIIYCGNDFWLHFKSYWFLTFLVIMFLFKKCKIWITHASVQFHWRYGSYAIFSKIRHFL